MTDAELAARFAAAQPAPPITACPAPELLLALARGEVADTQRSALADHLSRCTACRREFALLQFAGAGDASLTDAHDAPLRAATPWWRSRTLMAIAATLVVAVGLGAGVRGLWQSTADESINVLRGGDTPRISNDSGTNRSKSSLPLTLGLGDPLIWPAVADAVSYDVELLDHSGRLVAHCRAQDTTCVPASSIDTLHARRTLSSGQRLELIVRARGLDGVETTSAPIVVHWR